MEWYVLVLVLSFPSLCRTDCSEQCLKCALHISDSPPNLLACTIECEGTLPASNELDHCEKVLREQNEDDTQDPASSNPVKRYGGFIKRIDKNKNKLFSSLWRENAIEKGSLGKKYGDALLKLVERSIPELTEDVEGEGVVSENDMGLYDDEDVYDSLLPRNEVKRYGGFRRKFVPKRSEPEDEKQELQKRYGGFMRRIRPKLKWDNQKRYGGFLRRHFKISVRSGEEPSVYDDFGL